MRPAREKLWYDRRSIAPLGPVTILASPQGIRAIILGERARGDIPSGARRSARRLAPAFRKIRALLTAPSSSSRIKEDPDPLPAFTVTVLDFVRTIPFGMTMTYSEVARAVGRPAAVRAVGNALGRNPLPILIPCHRVVAAEGRLGGFSCGAEIKRKLLALENPARTAMTPPEPRTAKTSARRRAKRKKYLRMIRNISVEESPDWSVYILRCGDGSLYTGIAKNVAARLAQHASKRGAAYTRSRLPIELLYEKSGFTRSGALIEEARIKRLPRPKKLSLL